MSGCKNKKRPTNETTNVENGVYPINLETETKFMNKVNDDGIIVSASCTEVSPVQESNRKPTELSASLRKYNANNYEKVKKTYDEYVNLYKKNKSTQKYFYDLKVDVIRADTKVVSLLQSENYFSGGTHSNIFYKGIVFDTQTGKELVLEDVLTNTEGLAEKTKEILMNKYEDVVFVNLDTTLNSGLDKIAWTLTSQGITFYFSPYQIASYENGSFTATILFKNEPDLFNSYYVQTPDEYAMCITNEESIDFDLFDDNKVDKINILKEMADDSISYDTLIVSVNGNEISESEYYFSYDAYIAHTKNGDYLYAEIMQEDDFRKLLVYDLNSKNPFKVGALENTGFYEHLEKNNSLKRRCFADVKTFTLSTRFDILSTYEATRVYHLGDDGMPESDQKYYSIEDDITLKSKRTIEAELLDSKTLEKKGTRIAVLDGTRYHLVRTDGEKYVDATLNDTRAVRLNCQSDVWPQIVNGFDAQEIFDGLKYSN